MTIDPNTLNTLTSITLNVASNGLTSLLAFSGHKAKELVIGKDFFEQQELDKTALAPILRQAIKDAAEHAPWDAPKGVEIASLFLGTPEAEELVRQIYAMGFGSIEKPNDFTFIRASFIELLKHYADAYQPDLLPDTQQFVLAANALFDALLQACNLLLDKGIDKGVLAAHEAKDSFRYNIISSQLVAIQKELELLQSSKEIDVKAILDFEKQYRKQVEYHCSRITPPNVQGARKHPIDSLYVSPSVNTANSFFARKKQQEDYFDSQENINELRLEQVIHTLGEAMEILHSQKLDRDVFFARIYRAVVLGNPGAGKSTMTIKLCYDLAGDKSERLFARRQTLTPILVTLRVYGADKQKTGCSILNFIEEETKKTYQISDVPARAFDYLLQTGRAMVIFDGLDELLDTSYRQVIRDDIELFCQLYPSVPVLVTSREVGYEQAPLDENLFEVFQLAPFDDKQIDEYVHKWFTIADAEDISPIRRQNLAEHFLEDSKIVPDLRSNPLMLALLCTIYHQEGYIPRYRPDVYESCAEMLFKKWDKSRNIYDPPLPEEHVRPLLEYLAHWIYANAQLRAGITATTLTKKATVYLHEELYEDQRKAERVAGEFIEFCTGRAWVFIDTGTQKDGENLYQFAHATFLEYFAASQLARSSRSPSALLKVLVPHIAKQEWDVIAQLAFQIYNKQNTNAIDELLMFLVKRSKTQAGKAGLNLLSFAVRCLQFTIPRPNTRITITEACVERCINYGVGELEKGASQENREMSLFFPDEQAGYVLDDFVNLINENRTTVANTLYYLLVKHVNSESDNEAIIASEITLYMKRKHFNFDSVSNKIFDSCAWRIAHLYPKSLLLSQNGLWSGTTSVSELIKWHGVKSLFKISTFIISANEGQFSILDTFLHESFYEDIYLVREKQILEDIGKSLLPNAYPWLEQKDVPSYQAYSGDMVFSLLYSSKFDELTSLGAPSLFGVFCILAVFIEANNGFTQFNLRREQPFYTVFSHSIYLLLFARFRSELLHNVPNLLDQCHFTQQQQNFIWHWIRKEISLVASDKPNQDQSSPIPQFP